MKAIYKALASFNKILQKLEIILGSTCLGVLFLVMIVNAALRYFFKGGLNWSDELNGFLFVWFGFLAAAYTMSTNSHLNITAFINLFPKWLRYALSVIMNVIMIYMFARYMPDLGKLLKTLPKSNVMRIPLKYVYYILPASFILMIWHCAFNVLTATSDMFGWTDGKETGK